MIWSHVGRVETKAKPDETALSTPHRRDDRRITPHIQVLRRCRSAWSISTIASIASAIGVARMPTHGSWRPWVTISAGRPLMSIVRPGRRMLDVGFSAIRATMSCPLEIPPRIPPALLLRNPPRHLVAVLGALLPDALEPRADLHAFTR